MSKIKKENESWPKYWSGKLTPEQQAQHSELYREVDDETLHIGQCYENEAAKVLECCVCGGRDFNVGQGSYYTVIRCKICEWEVCVHNG